DLRVEQRDVRRDVGRHLVDLPEPIGPVEPILEVVLIEHADADDAGREIELRLAPDEPLLGCLRAVMSAETPTIRVAAPLASYRNRAWGSIHNTSPESARTIRCSQR